MWMWIFVFVQVNGSESDGRNLREWRLWRRRVGRGAAARGHVTIFGEEARLSIVDPSSSTSTTTV